MFEHRKRYTSYCLKWKEKKYYSILDDNLNSHSVSVILNRLIGESITLDTDNGDDEGEGEGDDEMDGGDNECLHASSSFGLLLIATPTSLVVM